MFNKKMKPLACKECGHYFEPFPRDELSPDLCREHYGVWIARRHRRLSVEAWAAKNWEALEPLSKLSDRPPLSIGLSHQNQAMAQSQAGQSLAGLGAALGGSFQQRP